MTRFVKAICVMSPRKEIYVEQTKEKICLDQYGAGERRVAAVFFS